LRRFRAEFALCAHGFRLGSEQGQSWLHSRPVLPIREIIASPKDRKVFKKMAAYQYIYVIKGLSKTYPGGREVLKNIWLSFLPGAKIGVLGPNGAGKSTLLKIMAGVEKGFNGEAWAAEGASVGYLSQEPELDPAKDVAGNVTEGLAHIKELVQRFEEVSARFGEELDEDEMNALIAEQGELQEQIDAANGWELDRMVEIAMDALRCPPGDADVTKLSGGERRRVALCRLLLQKPDLLLLDEPTNHLDAESVAWLQRFLHDYAGTVVTVTHDRYFLDEVAGWILELDRGQGIPYQGNYSGWLEQKQKRLAQEGKQEEARQRTLERELDWVRQSPRARQAKSKARLSAYEELLAQSREKAPETAQIVLPPGPRLGDVVIEAEHLSKAYGDRLLIDDLSFRLPPGGIVGIIGANGAGKTTLFRMITGQEQPDGGAIRIGETVKLGYVDQSRDTLAPTKTVWEEISAGNDEIDLGRRKMPSRAYCSLFNFRGSDQQKKVGQLSGGERNRVHLAKMLKTAANVILLDEPTNDLDVDTLRALEEALLDFPGCAVVITHDRWFLDRIATHILAFEGDSHVEWFEGNYADYEVDRKRRLGAEAEQPHRLRYKPLTRV
jgi:energy-dependent translational throttle protein EttA